MSNLQGPKAAKHADLFEYFETTIAYYRSLPTWKWLSKACITPSNSTSYTLSNLQTALKKGYGEIPYIGCSGPRFNETAAGRGSLDAGKTQLSEVWYFSHVNGAPQRIDAKRVPAGGSVSNCAKSKNAVWYYERAKGSEK